MKTFAVSLIILVALLISSVINCFYIDKISDKMLDIEKSFPEKIEDGELPPSEKINEAVKLWESSKDRLLASAKASYVNTITNSLNSVRDYYENGSPSDYISARSQLIEAIKNLKTSDSLKLSSII